MRMMVALAALLGVGCAGAGAGAGQVASAPNRRGSSVCQPRTDKGGGLGCSETIINARTLQVTAEGPVEVTVRNWAFGRAAEKTIELGYYGFVVTYEDSQKTPTVRKRLIFKTRRDIPTTILTVGLLTYDEFIGLPPGTLAYDARLILQTVPR
jgi:hypothetical protein